MPYQVGSSQNGLVPPLGQNSFALPDEAVAVNLSYVVFAKTQIYVGR